MAGLQDIRRRIRSVRSTQQVTKAMKMISAVKLRKSQERLLALRPYATRLEEAVSRVLGRIEPGKTKELGPLAQAFLQPREERRVQLLVVTSDRGFCGGFNANLLKEAEAFLGEHGLEAAHVDLVGRKTVDWARKRGLKAQSEHMGLALPAFQELAASIATAAVERYRAGEIDALYILYNHFNSPVSQTPKALKVFPVAMEPGGGEASHLLEPSPDAVLSALLPQYVETELLRLLLESSAAEHGARMSAMDKATSNAQDMIDRLTLNMNKLRQASITNQIIEIVSGANA